MVSDRAELSSIHGSLERIASQVSEIAARHDADPDDHLGPLLFEVDRSLRSALRKLERLQHRL